MLYSEDILPFANMTAIKRFMKTYSKNQVAVYDCDVGNSNVTPTKARNRIGPESTHKKSANKLQAR